MILYYKCTRHQTIQITLFRYFIINYKATYIALSCPYVCAKRFTLCSLAHLFNRTLSRLLRETLSQAAINARRHKYPPLSVARYSCIQLSKLEQCGVNKIEEGPTRQHQDSNPGSLGSEVDAQVAEPLRLKEWRG